MHYGRCAQAVGVGDVGRYSVGHHHGEWRYVHLVADVMGAGLPSIRRNGGVPLSWPGE